jgi:hypothetical protein
MLLVEKISKYLSLKSEYFKLISKLIENKVLTKDEKLFIFNNKINSLYSFKYPNYQYYLNRVKLNKLNKLTSFIRLLVLNQIKFQSNFLYNLKRLVSQIYNKNVEFNLINLKKMHLNSDIYTQAVSLKLKNRDNKLYRVLKASLRKIKLPVIRKIDEKQKKPNRDEFFINRIRNNTISTMFALNNKKNKNIKDRLQNLLLNFYPLADNLKINMINKSSSINRSVSLENYVLRSLKHVNLRGIRVEAKGRLTRRFTASRSVLKTK